jgi:hypothetical protein
MQELDAAFHDISRLRGHLLGQLYREPNSFGRDSGSHRPSQIRWAARVGRLLSPQPAKRFSRQFGSGHGVLLVEVVVRIDAGWCSNRFPESGRPRSAVACMESNIMSRYLRNFILKCPTTLGIENGHGSIRKGLPRLFSDTGCEHSSFFA